jgi:hypothetical protein
MRNAKREKIQDLFNLAMRVQMETEYAVFVSMSGHVSVFQVSIRKSKEKWDHYLAEGYLYYSEKWDDELEKRYNNMKGMLIEILQTGEFSPDSKYVLGKVGTAHDYSF